MHRLALAAAVIVVSGCALDPYRQRRPARLLVGASARDLGGSEQAIALRETAPSTTDVGLAAITGMAQFTMAYSHLVAGFELESGTLDARGSQFAGAYGVLGAEHAAGAAAIGVELAAGWRGVRHGRGLEDVDTLVAEPRVRGTYRLGAQVSLGAVLGATLGERGSWMAGLHIGFHSQPDE